jgi:hypothetical protein
MPTHQHARIQRAMLGPYWELARPGDCASKDARR